MSQNEDTINRENRSMGSQLTLFTKDRKNFGINKILASSSAF